MINSVTIIDGILKTLLGEKQIHFADFNLIYGSNGIGKSLLVKSIADKCLVKELGFSSANNFRESNLPSQYTRQSTIKVDWDLASCFFIGDYHIQDHHSNLGYEMCSGERIKGINYMKKWQNSLSTGQTGLEYLNDIFAIKLPEMKIDSNRFWGNSLKELKELFKSQKLDSKPTYIFDEIDSHLNIENQVKVLEKLKEFSKNNQVIVISHSPVVYSDLYRDHIIDLDGSYEKNKNILKHIISYERQ